MKHRPNVYKREIQPSWRKELMAWLTVSIMRESPDCASAAIEEAGVGVQDRRVQISVIGERGAGHETDI